MTFAKRQRYEGEWRDDQMTGRGVMAWKSGDRYTGQFVDCGPAGVGTMVFANGIRYEGEWRNECG